MSFVRKRVRLDRRGFARESYQLLETYRKDGKVRQRVIANLGDNSTPALALAQAERWLANASGPRVGKLRERVRILQGVVSRMTPIGPISDTTMVSKLDELEVTIERTLHRPRGVVAA